MRLPLIPPRQLSPNQRTLYDEVQKGMSETRLSTLVTGGPPTSPSRRAVPTTSLTRSPQAVSCPSRAMPSR
jgi:hypothetical protein